MKGRVEFCDETGEEARVAGLAILLVVVDEIVAAATQDFAHGGRRDVVNLRFDFAGGEHFKQLVGIAKHPAIKRIDEERLVFEKAADDEVAGDADGLEVEAEPFGHHEVNDAQGDRETLAPGQHTVEEAVAWIGVVFDVAAKTPLVKQDAIDDPAFLARRGGLDDQLSTAPGDLIEGPAALGDIELAIDGAGEEQRPRFQFVIERADETAEIGHRIAEIELGEISGGMSGELALVALGDVLKKLVGGEPELGEASR